MLNVNDTLLAVSGLLGDGSGGGGGGSTLKTKTVNANGEYRASDDSADGYSKVTVNVPNTYEAGDEGKVVSGGALVAQTTQTVTANGVVDTTTVDEVTVAVPNSYAAGDEGKVVSNGALVAQTNESVSTNGTVDTTTVKQLTVAVPSPTLVSKTVSSNGTYSASSDSADGYSSVTVNVPSGPTVIASGTFTGDGTNTVDIPIGKKCPQTSFIFRMWVDNGTEFTYDTDSKLVSMLYTVVSPDYFDLSTDGTKVAQTSFQVSVNNNGTITNLGERTTYLYARIKQNTLSFNALGNSGYARITRAASGFTVNAFMRDSGNIYVSGMTYNWELLYIGSDPSNDIVEVA